MKKLFFVFCLISSIPSFAQTNFDVCLSFKGYTGIYYLGRTRVNPKIYIGKGFVDTVFISLKPLTYYIEIGAGGYLNSQIQFTINPSGKVTIDTNPEAVTLKDTIISGKKIPKIVFNTDSVTIKPNGAHYFIYAFNLPKKVIYQSNTQPKTFTLIKGLSYMVANTKGDYTVSKPIEGNKTEKYYPEYFTFHLDKQGNVRPNDSLYENDILVEKSKFLIQKDANVSSNLKEQRNK
jgi:hypothetical protein